MPADLKRMLMDMDNRLGSFINYLASESSDDDMLDVDMSDRSVKKIYLDIDLNGCLEAMGRFCRNGSGKIFLCQHENISMLVIGTIQLTYKFLGHFDFHSYHTSEKFYTLTDGGSRVTILNCFHKGNAQTPVYQKRFSDFDVWRAEWNVSDIYCTDHDQQSDWIVPSWEVNCREVTINRSVIIMSFAGGFYRWFLTRAIFGELYAGMSVGRTGINIKCHVLIHDYYRIEVYIKTLATNAEAKKEYVDTVRYVLARKA